MQQEKYDIQKEFENAGLFLDEVEFDNIERLQYANSLSKEDWARSYIRRKRPEGLTLEIARDEIVRRKHKADALVEELRIKHRKVNFAAFAGAAVITATDCLSSPSDSERRRCPADLCNRTCRRFPRAVLCAHYQRYLGSARCTIRKQAAVRPPRNHSQLCCLFRLWLLSSASCSIISALVTKEATMSPFMKETLTGLLCIALLVVWVIIHVTHDLNNWNNKWK